MRRNLSGTRELASVQRLAESGLGTAHEVIAVIESESTALDLKIGTPITRRSNRNGIRGRVRCAGHGTEICDRGFHQQTTMSFSSYYPDRVKDFYSNHAKDWAKSA